MSSELALVHLPSAGPLSEGRGINGLRTAVLNGVAANSRRTYAPALDELSAFCRERQESISRTLILEFRAAMLHRELSASTINVKLAAVRKLVDEAKRAGVVNL